MASCNYFLQRRLAHNVPKPIPAINIKCASMLNLVLFFLQSSVSIIADNFFFAWLSLLQSTWVCCNCSWDLSLLKLPLWSSFAIAFAGCGSYCSCHQGLMVSSCLPSRNHRFDCYLILWFVGHAASCKHSIMVTLETGRDQCNWFSVSQNVYCLTFSNMRSLSESHFASLQASSSLHCTIAFCEGRHGSSWTIAGGASRLHLQFCRACWWK